MLRYRHGGRGPRAHHGRRATDRCYEVAVDFERYPDWARDVKEVTVLQRDDDGRGARVEYRVAGPRPEHPLRARVRLRATRRTRSRGASSTATSCASLDGRYGFEAQGDGTRVAYDLAIDVAIPLPGLIKRQAARMIVATALKELKNESERQPP